MTEAARVRLERPAASRGDEFISAVRASRALHADYVAPPATLQAYRRFVKQARLAGEERFLAVAADDALVGVVTLGAIVRRPLQSASIGYYAFLPFAGRGLMREAVGLGVAHAFGRLALERLDASIRPDNEASRRLAERLGFRPDGLAPHEVRIGGRWFAHERWVLHADDWARAQDAARIGPQRAEGGTDDFVAVHCRLRSR